MSDEDAKTYSEMEKKVANFTKEIERMQSMENMEREMAKPMSEPLTSQPMQAENNNDKPKKLVVPQTSTKRVFFKLSVLTSVKYQTSFKKVLMRQVVTLCQMNTTNA